MKMALVVSFDLPTDHIPEAGDMVADIIKDIDPPRLQYFDGELRVMVGDDAGILLSWMDEKWLETTAPLRSRTMTT